MQFFNRKFKYVYHLFKTLGCIESNLYLFQEDARIHMIYKSAGREGLRDLFGGKMLAE